MTEPNGLPEQVLSFVCDAVEKLNEELQYDSLEDPGRETSIWGDADGIDSISLVDFAVRLESRLAAEFGRAVVLTDERAFASENSPFRTVGSLTDFIFRELSTRE